jgi:DNA-binding LacI/PurR family transcriptional regulator
MAAEKLLARGVDFDSVFAASDVAAIGAMHALQHAGRDVPETAVVGFDDIPAACLASPSLTTITQDAKQAAEALIDTLIDSIERSDARDRVLPVRLTVRIQHQRLNEALAQERQHLDPRAHEGLSGS